MEKRLMYPIGIQTFSEIREKEYIYIDKTEYIYNLTHDTFKYVFLSRPRRFGKSLLASTLHCYFEGRKELFKGLAIEGMETEWTQYPVLHFDMSLGKHLEKAALERYLIYELEKQEAIHGLPSGEPDANVRLASLIERLYRKTGRQVVVIIDEYDAPLLDVVHRKDELESLRHIMRNFYSPLKACDPYLRFVFMTGITKFSQLSIFSELNNIANVSMDEEYATICGITEEEIRTYMDEGVRQLASKRGVTVEEAYSELKNKYDGYHFTWPSPDIYNPFSLINALGRRKLDSFWFGSATPTFLIEMLDKFKVKPSEIGRQTVSASAFDAPTERMSSITPLLYQSGYVTIKGYNPITDIYMLDIPNKEVRIGLMESLLPEYMPGREVERSRPMLGSMYEALLREDMDEALRLLQAFLSTVPYCDNTHYEGHYQQMLYIIFSMLGMYVDVEVRTPQGRVDMVMRTATTLYVVELKLDRDAAAAMRQIDLKQYPERFALCGLPLVKVGINFDAEKHTLGDWRIESVN